MASGRGRDGGPATSMQAEPLNPGTGAWGRGGRQRHVASQGAGQWPHRSRWSTPCVYEPDASPRRWAEPSSSRTALAAGAGSHTLTSKFSPTRRSPGGGQKKEERSQAALTPARPGGRTEHHWGQRAQERRRREEHWERWDTGSPASGREPLPEERRPQGSGPQAPPSGSLGRRSCAESAAWVSGVCWEFGDRSRGTFPSMPRCGVSRWNQWGERARSSFLA